MLPYVLMAAGAGVLGGVLAFFWAPGLYARSALQHFAAGVVIAAIASEVIPEVEKVGSALGILGGFAAGGLVMIGLKWVVVKFEREQAARKALPVGLAVATAFDTLLDGAIIAVGFSTGERLGPLLAIALGVELLSLTISVGSEFHGSPSTRRWGLAVTIGVSLLLLVGAGGASVFMRSASEAVVAVVLSFAAAALIYLIAEELLVESIQAEASLLSTAMLFAGFAAVLALHLFSRAAA